MERKKRGPSGNKRMLPRLLSRWNVASRKQAEQLVQRDRIHPTAAAHPRLLANVWAVMKPWLQ